MKKYALGLDFGTNSCRSLLVDLEDGRELASCVFLYPSGKDGILVDPKDPNVARQNPRDYLSCLEVIIKDSIDQAKDKYSDFNPQNIIGIGVDTTGSSPMAVDGHGTPLALSPEFKDNLEAMVWLWKDHSSHAEAARITKLAQKPGPNICPKSAVPILQSGSGAKSSTVKTLLLMFSNQPTALLRSAIISLRFWLEIPGQKRLSAVSVLLAIKPCTMRPGTDYPIRNFFLH